MSCQNFKNIRELEEFIEKNFKVDITSDRFRDYDDLFEEVLLKSKLPLEVKFYLSLLRTSFLLSEKIEKELKQFDLTLAQKSILDILFFSKAEYLTQNEISNYIFTSKANISSLLDKLEKKGYVIREVNSENRREKKVKVTKKGKKILLNVYLEKKKVVNYSEMGKFVNAHKNEFENFIKMLEKLKVYIKKERN